MRLYTSNEIRNKARETYGDGNFQKLLLDILADITERLERLEEQSGANVQG